MEIGKLRYLFGGVFKIAIGIFVVALIGFTLYSFFTRDNDAYGRLTKPYFQDLVPGQTSWNTDSLVLETPALAEVFKVRKRGITRTEAWEIAKKLELPTAGLITSDKEKNESFQTSSESRELFISLSSGDVHFKDSRLISSVPNNPTVNKEKALQTAKNIVSSLGINTKLYNLDKPLYEYLKTFGSAHLQESTEKDANLVYVSFPREILGTEVLAPGGEDLLVIGVNNSYQVFSINYSVLEIEESEALYKVLGEGSVKSKLRKGEGSLDHFNNTQDSIEKPIQIWADKGRIVFYNDKKTDFIQPIIKIKVLARSAQKNLEADVYLPALKDSYFKK